jgi:hypothetical protein
MIQQVRVIYLIGYIKRSVRDSSVDKMSGCELDALARHKKIFLHFTVTVKAVDWISLLPRIMIVTGSDLDTRIGCREEVSHGSVTSDRCWT